MCQTSTATDDLLSFGDPGDRGRQSHFELHPVVDAVHAKAGTIKKFIYSRLTNFVADRVAGFGG